MAGARRSARERGKSDAIDALAVARAALREGVDRLPCARLEGRSLEIRLLLDHHDDLVADRSDTQRRLRWHLHDLFDDLQIPAGALDRTVWLERVARRLARCEQSARVRIVASRSTRSAPPLAACVSWNARSGRWSSSRRRSCWPRPAAAR
jgi:hypothetical protein